jgi:hypothetical protein
MPERNAIELILDLHKADGGPPISELPGLWERKLDERWTIWVNGHMEVVCTEAGVEVEPGDCYAEFNGWPALLVSIVAGDGVIAAGLIANYDSFCEALRAAIEARKGGAHA